eukprot:Gb_37791 [translate_table: standard]
MAKEGNNIPWKMSKTCRGCTLKCWQTHTKRTLNNFSFFKVMMGNFSSFLEIPSEFANQMQYRTCKDAILEGPSGHLWHIHLCCTDSLPSFKDGWESFVSDHCIQSQDILVFRHIIDTHFSVQIFEPSGNEKLSTYSVENHRSCCLKMGNLSKICKKRRCTINRGKPIESCVILEDAFENIKIERLIGEQVGYAEAPIILVDEREVSDQVSSANTHDQGAIETCDLFHKKPSWHEDLESTVSTKRSGPSFSLVMKKTAVSTPFWLSFPLNFCKSWLPEKRMKALLVGQTGEWSVTFVGDRRSRGLGSGWKSFVSENKLQVGDTCVFELEDRVSHIFKIHISRAVKDNPARKKNVRVNALGPPNKKCNQKSILKSHTEDILNISDDTA